MVSPIFTERSGRPYSYDIFGGTRLSGGHESINGAGGAVYLPTVGRDTLRLPDTFNVDLRVSRVVAVGERVRVRGSVEVFNVTNHVNYSGVTYAGVSGGDGGEWGDSAGVSECGGGGGGGVECAAVWGVYGGFGWGDAGAAGAVGIADGVLGTRLGGYAPLGTFGLKS